MIDSFAANLDSSVPILQVSFRCLTLVSPPNPSFLFEAEIELAADEFGAGAFEAEAVFMSVPTEKERLLMPIPKTAIRLNPNYATAHQWYAEHLAFKGSTNEALTRISEALEIDPFSLVINRMKGNVLSFSNRHDEALVQFSKTLELYPNNASVIFNIGDTLAAKGLRNEAIEQYLVALELRGLDAKAINELRDASKERGWYGFWNAYLKQLLRARESKIAADPNAYIENESIAFAYAATGNQDLALEYLNRAYAERDPHLAAIRMSIVYEVLNDDPRYHELLKKIGL